VTSQQHAGPEKAIVWASRVLEPGFYEAQDLYFFPPKVADHKMLDISELPESSEN
jgi:hypothetical protein